MSTLFFILLLNLLNGTSCVAKNNVHIGWFKKLCDNFHTVERDVFYRSGQLRPNRLAKYIKKYGIKTVINLRGENKTCDWWISERDVASKLEVNFYNLRFSARANESKENLKKLLHIYKTAPKPILVHCLSGADRTGEAAALWIIEQQHKDKKFALRQLSIKYGYLKFKHPKKYFLVKHWNSF